jgi:hypothetical protein
MHGKESVEVEERYEAGELVPPYSKEEELVLVLRFYSQVGGPVG